LFFFLFGANFSDPPPENCHRTSAQQSLIWGQPTEASICSKSYRCKTGCIEEDEILSQDIEDAVVMKQVKKSTIQKK
jgi:hypothetical protein